MREEIARHTEKILRGEAPDQLRRFIVSQLGSIPEVFERPFLSSGAAITPKNASDCLLDGVRTRKLLCTLMAAIDHVKERKEGPVEVLEAGAGPHPLILLAASLRPQDVRILTRDIYEASTLYSKKLAHALGLTSMTDIQKSNIFEDSFEGCDPDIILLEMMTAGLLDEPQAEGEWQLARRFPGENVIRIPERITVTAGLRQSPWELQSHPIGTVATIDNLFRNAARAGRRDILTAQTDLKIPPRSSGLITLETRVEVGFGHTIGSGSSQVTRPLQYPVRAEPNNQISIVYKLGGHQVHIEKSKIPTNLC